METLKNNRTKGAGKRNGDIDILTEFNTCEETLDNSVKLRNVERTD